jgi:hypothetical protein
MRKVDISWHGRSHSLAHRDAFWQRTLEAEDIDSKVVGSDALAMKRIDTADLAEEVASCLGMELVLGKGFFPGQELELALVYFDHERIPPATDRTVAHGEFGEVRFDLETYRAAVTTALVVLNQASAHGVDGEEEG